MSKNTHTEVVAEKTHLAQRLFAAFFFIVCLAVVFLPIKTYTAGWVVKEQSLFNSIKAIVASEDKLFGVLPAFVVNGKAGIAATLALYVLTLTIVVSAVISFVAVWSKKSAPRRLQTAIFLASMGSAVYAITTACIGLFLTEKATIDSLTAILALIGMLLTFVYMLVQFGKAAWFRAISFLFSFVAGGLLVYAIVHNGEATRIVTNNATFNWMLVAIMVYTALNLIVSAIRTITKNGLAFDMVRFVLQLVISLLACYVGYAEEFARSSYLMFAIISALISILQIVVTNFEFERRSKKHLNETVESIREESLAGFETEEYVEAYPYAGGACEGVEVAEEVNLTAAQARGDKPDLATLVGNGFDPFLFTLSNEEKTEFVDLYILRCKWLMPEIPAYVVGGNNKDFFNKVFIYLGQYREKISNELLQKMYDFSMKLS